jgi:Rrf2 family iron-sulfur cluster assembly transcriptional regulator
MIFSKSFGYALRGILYIALTAKKKQRIQVNEIARQLGVPEYFLRKIMEKIVKNDILVSTKGPYGGFSLTKKTLSTPLIDIINITDGTSQFNDCVLRLKKCNNENPCPLHSKMQAYKNDLYKLYTKTTIGDLLNAENRDFIKSISTI